MTIAIVVIVVVVVIVLAALVVGGLAIARRRRTRALREQFGPEYDRVLAESGDRKEAEATLTRRRERHDELELRPLDHGARERYRGEWQQVQRSFVDDPGAAVDRADALVTEIMRERGYPVDDFEQRAADVSVEHPQVVEHYRRAREVRDAHRSGAVATEDLRAAVTSYRDLVDALLDEGSGGSEGAHREQGGGRHAGEGISGRKDDDTAPDARQDGSRR